MAEFGIAELVMLILSLIAGFSGGGEAPYEGEVTRVIDGDTVELQSNNQTYDIRLLGINAPETSTQYMNGFEVENLSENCRLAYGDLAERELEDEILNETVTLQYDPKSGTTGSYDRYLAEILVDGRNINTWMVENGFAVATTEKYDYIQANDIKYDSAEDIAEENNSGVWAGCSVRVPN